MGAGTVLDLETARDCLKAGACFITSPGFDQISRFGAENDVLVIPGVLTPSEVMMASRTGAQLIKIFPCAQVGGAAYIRTLRAPFPHIALIASGGVTQQTALEFILRRAAALGIGEDLIPREAVRVRNPDWIRERARPLFGNGKRRPRPERTAPLRALRPYLRAFCPSAPGPKACQCTPPVSPFHTIVEIKIRNGAHRLVVKADQPDASRRSSWKF